MIYPYECQDCKKEWEAEQSVKDEKLTECKFCKSNNIKRLISKTSFVLLGGSWAKDNYK